MKYTTLIIMMGMQVIFVACNKNKIESPPTAALIVINAVLGGGNEKLNNNERNSAKISNAKTFGLLAGETSIMLYSSDNPHTPYYYDFNQIENGGLYSIYLSGQRDMVDAIFIQDNIPSAYNDSMVGI